jgi:hypothetical protein
MTLETALEIVGNLSSPSKMPGFSFNISAKKCKNGNKLRKIKGSVCDTCYAFRGNYLWPVVNNAMEKRFSGITHPQWAEAMTTLIREKEKSGYFRFFDSGDLQSLKMLEDIVQIARNLPNIKFWLPTKEYSIISAYVKKHKQFPENLTVRLSAFMKNETVPIQLVKKLGVVTSSVATTEQEVSCPSKKQGNKCLECRDCWDLSVKNVSYKSH